MWRLIRWLIPLALITFGLLWPLVFRGDSAASDVSDPVVFSNYKADFVVDRDGQLDAVETITAEFPGGRHGKQAPATRSSTLLAKWHDHLIGS